MKRIKKEELVIRYYFKENGKSLLEMLEESYLAYIKLCETGSC